VLTALLIPLLLAWPARAADGILVFAAASLKNALDDADAAYRKEKGVAVTASYAASGPLAKQIEAGAPADIFISADIDWMNDVEKHDLVKPGTRKDLLGNTLVLVAPKTSTATITLGPNAKLLPLLSEGRLAIGDPQSVPAGQYGKQALLKLGLWDEVKDHLAPAENVRASLLLVSRGEAPLGIVYGTDAKSDPGVKVIATFPPDSHPPIIYPAALVTGGHAAGAAAFLAWLESPAAAGYFTKQGFTVLQ
jgi:molybdate transport system substrate-binding protein